MKRFWLTLIIVLSLAVPAYSADIRTGGGHQIQDTGSTLTQRPKLNFSGTIACTDNAGANSTDCEGGPATPAANYYVAGHMSPAELVNTDISTNWGTAKLGAYSLLLDGVNDYGTVKHVTDVDPTTAWTIEGWVKHTHTPRTGEILLHMDGSDTSTTFTDSGTGAHTFTAAGNAQIDTAQSKWGGASGLFDGTGDSISTPDHTNFDYSGGVWTVSVQGRSTNLSTSNTIFSQTTDANNYIWGYVTTGGAVKLSIFSASAEVLGTSGCLTADSVITVNNWYHIEFVENSNDYYVFVNGVQQCYLSDTSRPANYTGVLTIGNLTGGGVYWTGWLDEFRSIKGTAVHTANFNPPTGAYPYEYFPATIIGKYDNSASKGGYSLEIDGSGYLVGKHWSGTSSEACTGTTALTVNTWYHVAATYNTTANELKCYLDATQTGTTTTATGIDYSSTVPLIIGANGNSQASNYLLGYIDELAIWNTALPASGAAIDIADRYNAGSGAELVGTESNLEAVWHMNDGSGSIATQPTDQAGVGSDTYDCTSATYVSGTTGPCKTIQHVVDLFPKYFAGNSTLHIASGIYPEMVTIEGLHPSGEFTVTVKGYINSTVNQFSDSANSTGTSSGSNTANFPTDSGSLFKNTGASFTTADNEQLLKITGGLSYCSTAADAHKNWYRIDQQSSSTQLKVVTRWDTCGSPIEVPPLITTTSTGATGGSLTSSTAYYYRVSATNANGETYASLEKSQTSSSSGSNDETITINWNKVSGATGYKVYGRSYGTELLMATWNGSSWSAGSGTATSWTDTGSVTPSGALPTANTTQTKPDSTTTYNIYRDPDMATISGANSRNYGLIVNDSSGISIETLRFKGATLGGFYTINSTLEYVVGIDAESNYLTPTTGTYWTGGVHIENARIELMKANRGTDNYFQNYRMSHNAQIGSLIENISTDSYLDAGYQSVHNSGAELWSSNLSRSDAYSGFDIEYESTTYRFQYNRTTGAVSSPAYGGGYGFVVAGLGYVNMSGYNTFTSNAAHGILVANAGRLEYGLHLFSPASLVQSIDNSGYGILITNSGICVACEKFTLTGNASGAIGSVFENHREEESLFVKDDFVSGTLTSGSIGALGWNMSGVGSPVVTNTNTSRPGTIRLTTSATSAHRIDLTWKAKTEITGMIDMASNWELVAVVNILSYSANDWFVISMSYTTDNSKYASFQVNSGTTWTALNNNGSQTSSDTGITATAGTWYKLKIKRTPTSIEYYINDVLVITHTTNLPTGQGQPIFTIYNGYAAAKSIDIDYMSLTIPTVNR